MILSIDFPSRPIGLMKKMILLSCPVLFLTGCLTMTGTYKISAVDSSGRELSSGLTLTAQGRGIYSVRNALCQRYPGASVIIKDSKTDEQLRGESPFQCR